MSAVPLQEVVNALREYAEFYGNDGVFQLAVRIEAHGITPPDGWVLVPSKEFGELMFWLDRCVEKGHLDNCPDLIDPLADLNKAMLASAPEVKP